MCKRGNYHNILNNKTALRYNKFLLKSQDSVRFQDLTPQNKVYLQNGSWVSVGRNTDISLVLQAALNFR